MADRVVPLSLNACRSAQVKFSLLAPTKAGPSVESAQVSSVWIDALEADELFPETLKEVRSELYKPPVLRRPAARAARLDGAAQSQGRGLSPFFCMAQAPMVFTNNVGEQQVLADVVTSAPSRDVVETLRQPDHIGGRLAGDTPGRQAAFMPTRVHARPRPFFAAAVTPGTALPEEDESTDGTISAAAPDDNADGSGFDLTQIVGFDFALEPLFGGFQGKVGRRFQATRVAIGSTIGDTFGEALYVGVSLPSLASVIRPSRSSIGYTASPVDLTMGVLMRTDDFAVYPSGALSLSLGDAFSAIAGVLGFK